MPAENAKALGYIAQLDDARCNARWDALPELARKIEKHASHRTCIYTTARAEAGVAVHIKQHHEASTAAATPTTSSPDLFKLIDSLTQAKDQETTHKQDAFAAQTCLAWIHWELAEPDKVLSIFPGSIAEAEESLRHGDESFTGWTQVCIVKAAYLKGVAQEKMGSVAEAIQTYQSILHFVGSDILSSASVQFKVYSEALLARLCLLLDLNHSSDRPENANAALHAFRLWSRLMEGGKAQFSGEAMTDPPDMRRVVWKAYYDTLSIILRRGLLYSGSSDPDQALLGEAAEHASQEQYTAARLQQRAELKLVETVYEALLLKETRFPKASGTNEEVDDWTESVMSSWRIICGPAWTDEELGEGGKAGVGKGVLDILYRAATKSYHSTRVLRHLFIVHASLAEFELAFKAFDSYVEIVSRGKDRAEKSGEEDAGLDDDNTVLRTAAEAVRILCRFGMRQDAEKAKEVGEQIERWLKQQTPASRPGTATTEDGVAKRSTESLLSPRVLALAYRAVGISRAHWARLTYEATARATFQAQAVQALRKSLSPEFHDSTNLETLYALGLLLAEMRDIGGAIKVVKRALSSNSRGDGLRTADGVASDTDAEDVDYIYERKLIPLWHLLALLLTAKSDFTTAARTCDAAFDQFDDPTVLFGNQGEAYRSEHLNETSGDLEKARSSMDKGLVDRMESFEKEGILQVKVTQLMLLEVVEGTTAAVDASMELLALYRRLFGDLGGAPEQPQSTEVAAAQNAPGNRASFFGRTKTLRKNTITQDQSPTAPSGRRSTSSRPSTNATEGAPTIQVTDESGKPNSHHHHGLFHHKHLEKSSTGSIKLRKRSASNMKTPDSAGRDSDKSDGVANGTARRGSALSNSEQPLRQIPHNIAAEKQPAPAGHTDRPPRQDVRLPTSFPRPSYTAPEPRFPLIQERRHTTSLLIDVWLFIAGLYTRAALLDDAKGAVDEAFKLADNLESEISHDSSSARAFSDRGWGGGKSIEELWADIWAARGGIAHAGLEPYEALGHFEKGLSHNPDHPVAVVGLSELLLDIYCKVIPAESVLRASAREGLGVKGSRGAGPDPEELNRLAARDRAYGLLSSLTKLGTGWDYSEAWFALARAYEEGGQVQKAKDVLWWCIELEDSKALRKWSCVGVGGFVL